MFTILLKTLRLFRKDTRGATAIEYGLIAAGIAVAIAAAVFALGDDLTSLFEGVSEEIETRTPSGTTGSGS